MVRYALECMQLDDACRTNIIRAGFDAGRMMHGNPPDLKKMQKDLVFFEAVIFEAADVSRL
jgi:hypothetical protein